MIKKISLGLLIMALSTSCVSKKIYNDLENKFTDLKKENRSLADENSELTNAKNQLELDQDALKNDFAKLKLERDKWLADYGALSNKMDLLNESYKALEKNSNEALQINMSKNRDLLTQLDAKGKALAIEQERKVEFFGEWGHRWLDLKRTNRADAVLGGLKPKTWKSTAVLYPIPENQRLANRNLTQNSGY